MDETAKSLVRWNLILSTAAEHTSTPTTWRLQSKTWQSTVEWAGDTKFAVTLYYAWSKIRSGFNLLNWQKLNNCLVSICRPRSTGFTRWRL